MENKKLSIVIPTYNRPSILAENLKKMMPEIKKNNIPIYVSDDSNNLETKYIVLLLQKEYKYLYYRNNIPPFGHDKNCLESLIWPETDYIWYLGDSMMVNFGGFSLVLDKIVNFPDFIFVDCNATKVLGNSRKISDTREFIEIATWYLTLSGATIYSKKIIEWFFENKKDIIYKNFQQLGIILSYIEEHKSVSYWISDKIISVNRNKKSYWRKDFINVFGHDWCNLIDTYKDTLFLNNFKILYKSHNNNAKLFNYINILNFRADNYINLKIIKKNQEYLMKILGLKIINLYLICLIPYPLLKFIKKVLLLFRSKMRRS